MSGAGLRALLLALCGLSLLGCSRDHASLAAGPYVQDVTTASAIVAAISDGETTYRVRWGEAGGELSSEVKDADPARLHGLQLDGLQPGRRYDYRLENAEGGVIGTGQITTAPLDSSADCHFLVLGDSGGTDEDEDERPLVAESQGVLSQLSGSSGDENRQGDVARAMQGRGADLVLHLGDVVYPAGEREDYPEGYFRPFAELIRDVPVYATLGNHDVKTENGAPFLENFYAPRGGPDAEGRTYSFDWGVVHFTCLDVVSSDYGPGSAQGRWLAQDLARSAARWKVVFFHYPPFSPEGKGNTGVRADLLPLLEEGRVDLVLSGHDHAYARFTPRHGTLFVVSGGGGKNLRQISGDDQLAMDYAESVFHFLDVRASGTTLELTAIDAAGNAFDHLALLK